MPDPKFGYMLRPKPMSRQEALQTYSRTSIVTITKKAIESYLRSFFDSNGENRETLTPQLDPGVMTYLSDLEFSQELDQTKTKLVIARYQERLKSELPAIVIADTGLLLKRPGFGKSFAQARVSAHSVAHHVAVIRDVNITLVTATSSQSDTEKLSQFVQLVFFDMAPLLIGSVLRPTTATSGQTWMVRLPNTMDAGGVEKNSQSDDPNQQVWTSTLSFTASFEDSFIVGSEAPEVVSDGSDFTSPVLEIPDTMRVGQRISGDVLNLETNQRVVTSAPGLLTISESDSETGFILTARRPGTAWVRILSGASTDRSQGQGATIQPNVVLEKQVTITY